MESSRSASAVEGDMNMEEVTLKEHIESQLKTLQAAIDKAEAQFNARLVIMNEFREALQDQTTHLVNRTECGFRHQALEEKVRSLELSRSSSEGRATITASVIAICSSLIVGIVTFLISRYIGK